MSYKKIEVIDQLKLTYDLLNIIKSYCFYDITRGYWISIYLSFN